MTLKPNAQMTGLILAGGQSQRMGKDKALLQLAGQSLIEIVESRLASQVSTVIISTNNPESLRPLTDSPLLSDPHLDRQLTEYSGPLAGILAGLVWLREQAPESQWLLSVAVDTPQFPVSLADDLLAQAKSEQSKLVCAASDHKLHPTCALWHRDLLDPLQRYLLAGERRLMAFHRLVDGGQVSYPAQPSDPFLNLNTPEDLMRLAKQ